VAELTVLGKPAILIPYPYAAYDHQRQHAEALQKKGAADMILDQDLTGERLADHIRELLLNADRREKMAQAAKSLGRPEATKRIVDECCALVQRT
jgi:UDP-N-acetylglucosamine--N-acetylmuramyl-(pentapeptide) pyrophosphoryl-undecaprenol N-acetylglucosamine transferase